MICEELTTKIEEVMIEFDINVKEELNNSNENVELVNYNNDEVDAVDCLGMQPLPSEIKQDDAAENTPKKRMQYDLKGSRKQIKKQTAKLINLVKKCPMLYDPSHKDYKRNREKNKTWEHFAEVLGADSGDAVKAKWKNLRDSYCRTLRFNLNSLHNRTSCYKKWIWIHKMSFLQPYLDPIPVKEKNDTPKKKPVKRKKLTDNTLNDNGKCFDQTDLIFLDFSKTLKKMSKKAQVITKFKIAEIMMKAEEEIEDCDKQTKSESDNIEVTKDIYFKCEKCSYKTVIEDSYKRHMNLHDETRQYVCDICGYRFKNSLNRQTHMKDVHDEKKYKCDTCDYRTNRVYQLTTHLKIHSGEKLFSCSKCGYRCTRRYDLTVHMRCHMDEKPYFCSLCNFKCKQKTYLTSHLKTHTSEKPYACSECSYKSARQTSLSKHIQIHHG